MLISNNKKNLIVNSLIEIDETDGKGKGHYFKSRFIEPGVAHYDNLGDILIKKETLDKFLDSMVGCPVIINHKDVTDKNVDKLRVGTISRVWFEPSDGWFYCEGIITDEQAVDLIKNQGWNVSCSYNFVSDNTQKTHNGKKIDMEFTDGEFLHLAIVETPRYEGANIVVNSADVVENDHWITIGADEEEGKKGHHVLVKDGETHKEATERKVKEWEDKKEEKKEQPKEDKKEEEIRHENFRKSLEHTFSDYGIIEQKKELTKRVEKYRNQGQSEIADLIEESLKLKEENHKLHKDFIDKKISYDEYYKKDREHEKKEEEIGDKISELKSHSQDKGEDKQADTKKESPFGDGVEVIESDKKGHMFDSKNLKAYKKGEKFAIVDDWSHDDKDRFTVSFHDGKKRLSSKTYSTKSGMEKAIREHLQGGANKETKALESVVDLDTAEKTYKDTLKRYKENDSKRWQSGLSTQEYYKAYDEAEKAKKELTKARREYAESIMANFEAVKDNPYEQRQEDKKMRYEEMAQKAQTESDRIAKQSRDMISAIPMGQPILVGHHSEMRDRRYRQRAWDKMDKAYQLSKKSDYYENKASSVGKAGISADDANAIAKLAQKYKSGVDSAEKRRIIDRVIDIHSRKNSNKPASETTDYGFKVERNTDLNRLQLKFDGKPDEATRSILKSNGFRWSPREGAWQRQLNGNGESGLNRVIEKLKVSNCINSYVDELISEVVVENCLGE